jgi:hypothetical protein
MGTRLHLLPEYLPQFPYTFMEKYLIKYMDKFFYEYHTILTMRTTKTSEGRKGMYERNKLLCVYTL